MARVKFQFIFIFLLLSIDLFAQKKIFHDSGPGQEAFRMKVIKDDTVIIAEDSAFVYSLEMVGKIHDLEQLYLSCLSLRDNDLAMVKSMLATLQESYTDVNDLITRSSNISKEQIGDYQQKIAEIISNLQRDITTLQQLQYDLGNAREELGTIKREIKKERSRLWWKKTGSIFIAVIVGFTAGFIVAS